MRSSTYWRPTSAVSVTQASATLQPSASAWAHAASVARREPPKRSISHVASKPAEKRSRWSVRPVPAIDEVSSPRSIRVKPPPTEIFGMNSA